MPGIGISDLSKRILIGLGLLFAIVVILFATGVIQIVSVEEAYQLQQKEKKMIAELETKMSAARDKRSGSKEVKEMVALPDNDKVSLGDLDRIRALIDSRQFQSALDAHLWFHEASKNSPAMAGVRLSFALSSWLELAESFSPALDALKAVGAEDKNLLLSGDGDFGNFLDLSAINRTLNSDQETLDLFLTLYKRNSKQIEMYYRVAEDLLIEAGRYDIVSKYIGDPIVKFENLRYMREMNISHAESSERNKSFLVESANDQYIDGVLKLIKVCVAIGKSDAAIEVQKRALVYLASDQIRVAL